MPNHIEASTIHGRTGSIFDSPGTSAELLLGARALERATPAIRELRARYGLENDFTTDPQYFMATNAVKNRKPAAVLIRRENALEACVLFFEHCVFNIGLGLFRGGDYMGEGLLVAPQEMQVQYLQGAVQFLLRRWRIHGISISAKAPVEECIAIMGPESEFKRFRGKTVQHKFPLLDTYQATLAALGHRTRRSLAGKREHLEKSTNVQFLPDLGLDETMAAMSVLKSVSVPMREERFVSARVRLIRERPNVFFNMGLRLPDGTWLSVLSGWRIGRVTYIDTQMNHAGFKKESISAVMRAFMLEHETGLQQRLVNFVAGSSLLLRRYCEPLEPCTDAFICRPGLLSKLSGLVASRMKPGSVYERLGPLSEGEASQEIIE